MENEKINSYSHIYLYAKHWYKRTDPIKDLKILISNRCGIDVNYINVRECVGQLVDLVWLAINKSGNPQYFFCEFISDITFDQDFWKFGSTEETKMDVVVINKCLSVLSLTRISDIDGKLAEPDSNILPFEKEDALERFREMNKK